MSNVGNYQDYVKNNAGQGQEWLYLIFVHLCIYVSNIW